MFKLWVVGLPVLDNGVTKRVAQCLQDSCESIDQAWSAAESHWLTEDFANGTELGLFFPIMTRERNFLKRDGFPAHRFSHLAKVRRESDRELVTTGRRIWHIAYRYALEEVKSG